ncbi:lipoprotein-releasing ABC transporter permease subunit [Beggiatoa leptomitoformis]|uniref:Lipoprotein-releasing ABC transporter permease subunit n=1 Tax=Beggiatoa leptomitoformis TaxID=288004 RepID=A0A2N9YGI2_9GAMM|nr:lipoprotein-releasing ABC transporter permease subunit [Beggiatoa leptomitoformis]ALG68099.1 lipoprotein-releasing ABC transporter permease subunit [Beggiatoa leptomitoformis]AUI69604.1 lipoprotein-releasing ABC transporter permease subunit [Beggiatoa leptomitoformis]
MFKPLPLFIGFRYTRAKRRNHFISFISLTSMLGIALGVTALITVLSVMNGFEKELRERMLGMAAHVVVTTFDTGWNEWREWRDKLKTYPHITGVAPFIQGQGMITYNRAVYGTYFQGIDPSIEPEISQVTDKMQEGSLSALKAGEFGVVIGRELQKSLQAKIGDKITLVVPETTVTPVGVLPRMKRLTLVGVFEVGMHEYDSAYILMHIDDAAKLMRIPDGEVHGLNVKLDDLFLAKSVSYDLREKLPFGVSAYDWTYRHANFFKAIQMEKRVMFVILALIVAVAAFNIVSTLVMVVTDKQADIAILRTLGATPLTIMAIFIVQGTLIGIFGTLLGLAGGISLALNVETIVPFIEHTFNVQFLPGDVYYISDLPSDLQWFDVYRITGMSLLISLLATLYPAWRASRTQPAEALRYE